MTIPQTHQVIQLSKISPSFDAFKYTEVAAPQITSPNDVIIKNKYAGVNLIDAYFRKGILPVPSLPTVLGCEAAGVVVATGENVKNFKVGDKIAYFSPATFAQYTKITDSHTLYANLGDASDEELKVYGSALATALTSIALVEDAHEVKKGEFILVWAAAGGVGSLLVQLVKAKGGRVIAISLSKEKLELASSLGAEFLINHRTDDVAAKVKEFTNGEGVAASLDSIGKDTFEISLEALALKGSFVSYGNATGIIPPFSINRLTPKNIQLSRPSLFGYLPSKASFDHYFDELRRLLESGELKFTISKVYPLSEYAEATRALENNETTHKLTLEIPQ